MTSRDFCYWLQGYFEIALTTPVDEACEILNLKQVQMIRKHLAMVFIHEIDPSMPNPKLDKIHAHTIGPVEEKVLRC